MASDGRSLSTPETRNEIVLLEASENIDNCDSRLQINSLELCNVERHNDNMLGSQGEGDDDEQLPDTEEDKSCENDVSSGDSTDDEAYDEDREYPNTPESTDSELANLENPKRRKRKAVSGDYKDMMLCIGQQFQDRDDFRSFLTSYSLSTGYDIRINKATRDKMSAVCSEKSCRWRVYASVDPDSCKWLVKTLNDEHTCEKQGRTKMLNISEITKMFLVRLTRKPKLKAAEMKDEIKREYNMTVSRNMCSKAKRKALDIVRGSFKSQFANLKNYAAELRRSNPDTTAELETKGISESGSDIFHRFYICFAILKRAWKANCRPVIGLDGCFLKWDTQAQLLAAIGRDADNRIFPIAWAIVDIENIDNWEWFISHMKSDLELDKGDGLTVISDKQKGLLNAMAKVLPEAEHRMCARHIYSNWRKNHKEGMLKPLFWAVARSFNETSYNENMDVIKQFNQPAYDSLLATNPRMWCRAFFRTTSRCPDCHNNLSKSFNNSIKEARTKPVLDMLEDIRRATMNRITERKVLANRHQKKFTPKANDALEKAREESRQAHMWSSTDGMYEIVFFGHSYPVSLTGMTCDCREWDLTGLPCLHAICAINENRLKVEDFVSDYYLASKWRDTYCHSLRPIRREPAWPKVDDVPVVAPTTERKKAGRPKKHARKKGLHESPPKSKKLHRQGYKKRCSHCKEEGHTRTTCPNKDKQVSKPVTTPRPRGRPPIQVVESIHGNQSRTHGTTWRQRHFEIGSSSGSMSGYDSHQSSSASLQYSSQAPFPSQASQQSYTSEFSSQQSYSLSSPIHTQVRQSEFSWMQNQHVHNSYPPLYTIPQGNQPLRQLDPNHQNQPYYPPPPLRQPNQPYQQPYTNINNQQSYPSPSSHQQPSNRPSLGRRRERIPQGYGLYVSTRTNNIYFRRGPRRVEVISRGQSQPPAL